MKRVKREDLNLILIFIAAAISTIAVTLYQYENMDTRRIKIKNEAIKGQGQFKLEKGKTYTFIFNTDKEEQIHIDGYPNLGTVKPGSALNMQLDAQVPGTFPIKLDLEDKKIGELVIN